MRFLLDTHVLLKTLIDPSRLPPDARTALEAPENLVYFSAASIWEIAIKRALDKPDFDIEPDMIRSAALETGFEELGVSGLHAARVRHLPHLHSDPFDRLLVAQAQIEPLTLMTDDPQVAGYAVNVQTLCG
jgi:PIN domain nuclease of toxin-antitoxin system